MGALVLEKIIDRRFRNAAESKNIMSLVDAYYIIKPLIPRRVQLALRRQIVKRKLEKVRNIWPIDPDAGNPPPWWKGWPEGKQFALVLTHDVETAKGRERVLQLARLEQELGFKSCFNFVGGDYLVYDQILHTLKEIGFEVGVHGYTHKGNLFRSRSVFEEQKKRINQKLKEWDAVGFRAPSMYHNLAWIGEMDIEYDMSTFDTDPFEPQSDGVRTIFPFWVNSGSNGNGYVELPYTLSQDHLLFILLLEKSTELWKKKVDWIFSKGGMVLINTHPDYVNLQGGNGPGEEYPAANYGEFLENLKEKYSGQYWHVLPRELARFWRINYGEAADPRGQAEKFI
jgi:peptidoglycan/xylan/chitin deacetylase (PgdA/CDA1 family)